MVPKIYLSKLVKHADMKTPITEDVSLRTVIIYYELFSNILDRMPSKTKEIHNK